MCVYYIISQLSSFELFLKAEAIKRIFFFIIVGIIKVKKTSCKGMILHYWQFVKWSVISGIPWSAKLFLFKSCQQRFYKVLMIVLCLETIENFGFHTAKSKFVDPKQWTSGHVGVGYK